MYVRICFNCIPRLCYLLTNTASLSWVISCLEVNGHLHFFVVLCMHSQSQSPFGFQLRPASSTISFVKVMSPEELAVGMPLTNQTANALSIFIHLPVFNKVSDLSGFLNLMDAMLPSPWEQSWNLLQKNSQATFRSFVKSWYQLTTFYLGFLERKQLCTWTCKQNFAFWCQTGKKFLVPGIGLWKGTG